MQDLEPVSAWAGSRASATYWDWEAKGVMAALLLAVVTAAARSHTHSPPTPPPPAPVDVPPEWRSGVANGDLLFAAVPPSQKVSVHESMRVLSGSVIGGYSRSRALRQSSSVPPYWV